MSLWEQELGSVAIVQPANIVSHFARLDMDWVGQNHIAVISLSRVCGFLDCCEVDSDCEHFQEY